MAVTCIDSLYSEGMEKNGKMKQKHESGKNAHTHSGERLSSGDD